MIPAKPGGERDTTGRAPGKTTWPQGFGKRGTLAPMKPRVRMQPALRAVVAAACVLAASGCALLAPPVVLPGHTQAEAERELGRVTGRYAMPGGVMRLEFARGPMGRETYMVDIDAGGRVLRSEQVLSEQRLASLRIGMHADEVLRLVGRPAEKEGVGWRGWQVWSWRFPTQDCRWFRITFDAQQRVVEDGAFPIDLLCEPSLPPP